MLGARKPDPLLWSAPYITSECHNRAVNEQVFIGFKQEFHDLEREGILDPLNEPDMFCLQYIYLPRHLCPEMHAMTKMADLAKELHN